MVPDIWFELIWSKIQVFAFNAAISACEKSGEWQQVSEILGSRCPGQSKINESIEGMPVIGLTEHTADDGHYFFWV